MCPVWKSARLSKAALDHGLRLYAGIFTNGYLHDGYFVNPDIRADEVNLRSLSEAQEEYAERLLAYIEDKEAPLLNYFPERLFRLVDYKVENGMERIDPVTFKNNK